MKKDNLPNGWVTTKIDKAALIILGQSPPSSTYNDEKRGLPFFQGKTDFGLIYPTARKWCTAPKKIAEKNDILISVRAPVGPTNLNQEKCCIGRGLSAIRPHDGIDFLYVFYQLRALENIIQMKGTGTTFKAITGDQLKSILLKLPPFNEQKRIVTKIESIFAQIDATKEELNKISMLLNPIKQSVLKSSFKNKHIKFEIKTARELFYIKGRIGWRGLKKSDFTKTGPYLITGVNFYNGKINWENCYHVPIEKYEESPEIMVQHDDILLTKDGTIGKIAYVDKIPSERATLNAHLLLIRNLENNKIFPKYVFYLLHSPYFHFYVNQNKTGTTRPSLTQRLFEKFTIPVYSIEEQKCIVTKIESIFAEIDSIDKFVNEALKSLTIMKQSVLKQAFEGKLVPQDPNDEPASILLEKIQKEKSKK